jgi:hypothetical protein
MHEQPAVGLLKQDVAATLGAAHVAAVDARARLLLPFADWPQDAYAAKLIDGVQQELHYSFVDTTWPHCPSHPHHPMWFEGGVWRCGTTGSAVAALGDLDVVIFNDALEGLRRGDFDRLEPLFRDRQGEPCLLLQWREEGRFADHPAELAEALSNACFLGRDAVVRALVAAGVEVTAGTGCGMDGLHWAANRGKLDTVRLLISLGAPLETVNMHGTTVLGTAVWSAVNEPWWGPAQLEIIKVLLDAGARVEAADYPSGRADVDELLRGRSSEL